MSRIWQHGFGLDFDTTTSNGNDRSLTKKREEWISSTYCMILRGEWTTAATNNENDEDATAAVQTLLNLLPPLKSLSTHAHNTDNRMNMVALVQVLQHSQGTLKVFRGPADTELRGSEADFRSLLQSLRLLKALEIFEWNADGYCTDVELEVEQEPNIVALNIDDVLQALVVANASLTSFSLGIYDHRPSPLALQGFLHGNKSTLQTLKAKVGKWDRATVQTMKAFLANDDCRVEELTIGCCIISTKRFPIIKDVLEAALDTNSVRMLEIHPCALADGDELLFEFYRMVTALLKTNASLRSFVQACGNCISKAMVLRIAKLFVNALKENTTLMRVELLFPRHEHHPAMDEMYHYLKLNRLGRKNILENSASMTRSDWTAQMAKDTSNVDWLLFLLKSNPMLCQSTSTLLPNQQPNGDATPSSTAPSGAESSVSGSSSIKRKSNGRRKRE